MRIRSLLALVLAGFFYSGAAYATCSVPVCIEQDGARLAIGSSGEIDIESGGSLEIGGVAVTATAAELNALDASAGTGITLQNGESLNTSTDDVFDFTRDDAGTVTITASDDNAVAALTVLPGGAAALTLGGASTTSVTVTTDSTGTAEVVLPASSVGVAEIAVSDFIGSDPGATCTAGQWYIDTDETVDTNCTTTGDNSLCLCIATNTWTQLNNN